MFKINYHTHTSRCGHAYGSDEEYIKAALNSGYTTLGFSDHIMLPGLVQPTMRGNFSDANEYYKSIRNLKEQYKDQMEIFVGYEAEAFANYFPYFYEILHNNTIDYLILGNHMMLDEHRNIIESFSRVNSVSSLYRYLDMCTKAIKSDMFSIFAHPDIVFANINKYDGDCEKVATKLIEVSMEHEVPLEINLGGIRTRKREDISAENYLYPTAFFFSIASKMNADTIIGVDAHDPDDFINFESFLKTEEFIKKNNLKVIEKLPSFKKPR